MSSWLSATPRRIMGLPAVFLMAATAGVAQSFGRFAFGVVLPAVRTDLGISNTIAGSLTTMNVGAYLAGTLAVSALAGTYKLLSIMRVGFIFSLLGLILAATAPGVSMVAIAMFASGFGGAMIWIPAPVIAAAALPAEKRSLGIGLLGSGMGAGVVFASQLSSYVRSSSGDGSWRTVYVVLAVIAFTVLVSTLLFVGHEQDQPTGNKGGFGGVTALKRMRAWVPLTAAYTSFGFMYLLILAFLSTKLEEDNGWTSSRASLAFTLVGIAMMFGGPLFIAISRRLGSRRGLAIAFTGWAIVVLLILPGWVTVTLPASIAVGLLFAGIPSTITLYVVENTTVEDYGPAFAAATLAFGVAQMVGPQAGGFIADLTGSFTTVFLLSAALAVTGLIAALQLPAQMATGPLTLREARPMEVAGSVIASAIHERHIELQSLLASLSAEDLLSPSLLPDWDKLTIVCHLRYGAQASRAVTVDALAGRTTAYYPKGRSSQRPATLRRRGDERPGEVIAKMATRSSELDQLWMSLAEPDWSVIANEPSDNVDLGPIDLKSYAVLRLTEAEVHGSDLDIGAKPWSEVFVDIALPMRVRWLQTRRSNHREVAVVEGSWALRSIDGPSFVIAANSDGVSVVEGTNARAVIQGTKRELLAFLLGRVSIDVLTMSGDHALARQFRHAFPGP